MREKCKTLEEVVATLRQHMPELREHYKVRSLAVFGSYTRGKQGERSDLDILVEFSQTPDLFKFMDLEDELSRLTGLKVELVSANALRGNIGSRILEELVRI